MAVMHHIGCKLLRNLKPEEEDTNNSNPVSVQHFIMPVISNVCAVCALFHLVRDWGWKLAWASHIGCNGLLAARCDGFGLLLS